MSQKAGARGVTRSVLRRTDSAGFVLVLVLLMLGIISASIVTILVQARAGAAAASLLQDAARARSVSRAATVRAIHSAIKADGWMRIFEATEAKPVQWRFDNLDVELFVTPESDKVDINAGRMELVQAVLEAANLDTRVRSHVLDVIERSRAGKVPIPSLAALVAPCDRLKGADWALERWFTVMTGARGIAPRRSSEDRLHLIPSISAEDTDRIRVSLQNGRSPLDDLRLIHLRPYLSDGSSLYAIHTRAKQGDVTLAERRVVVALEVRWPTVRVVTAAWKAQDQVEVC